MRAANFVDGFQIFQVGKLCQRHWMDADVIGHNKFHASQANSVIGDCGQMECLPGIRNDQHHFCVRLGNRAGIDMFDAEWQPARINMSFAAFGAAHCNFASIGQQRW